MEFSCAVKDLVALVRRACGVIDKRTTMPVLANAFVVAENGTVTVTGTDLYMTVVGSCTAQIKKPGSVCLPANDLLARLSNLPAGDVSIRTDAKEQAEIKSMVSPRRYRLFGMPGDSYPPVPKVDEDSKLYRVPSPVLIALISRTEGSVSADSTRPHLNSMLIVRAGDRLIAASTDGHRLNVASEPCECDPFEMLVPLKGIVELRKMLDGVDAEIPITLQGVNATFEFSWGSFTAKLTTECQVPAWEQVLPKVFDRKATVPRAALIESVRAVGIASSDRSGAVKFSFDSGTLKITAETVESGAGADEVAVDYVGAPLTIGLNSGYLIAALQCAARDGCEEALIEMNGELDPVLVSAATDHEAFRGVVMPLRI